MSKELPRLTIYGKSNAGKSNFTPYFTGQLEVTPPIAEAMFKCGYITQEEKQRLEKEYQSKHGVKK